MAPPFGQGGGDSRGGISRQRGGGGNFGLPPEEVKISAPPYGAPGGGVYSTKNRGAHVHLNTQVCSTKLTLKEAGVILLV